MKLIFCPECKDIRKLIRHEWRRCSCKASGGQYESNGWHAKIAGKAIALGINNIEFRQAINFTPHHKTYHFEAFVFPLEHPRIEYVEESEF